MCKSGVLIFLFVLLLPCVGQVNQPPVHLTWKGDQPPVQLTWKPVVEPDQIRAEDGEDAYDQVLDVLFPRKPVNPIARTFVIRCAPVFGPEYQVNILAGDRANPTDFEVWTFEAPSKIWNLLGSGNAKRVALETKVKVRKAALTPKLKKLVSARINRGIRTDWITEPQWGGNWYHLWARWGGKDLEIELNDLQPSELTRWADEVWKEANKQSRSDGRK